MKRRTSYLMGALFLFAALAGASGPPPARPGPYLNNKLKAKEVTIHRVVLLPCIVEVSKEGVKGKEGMGKEGEDATAALAAAISADLGSSGLTVDTPFTEDALKDNNDLKYAVADVQRKYDEISQPLYRKSKDIRKGRFTLGDMVAVLNTKGNADALVFVHADGVKMTKGKGALSGGLIGLAMSGSIYYTTRVVLVDAKNGDVLYLDNFNTGGIPKDKAFDKSFKKIVKPK